VGSGGRAAVVFLGIMAAFIGGLPSPGWALSAGDIHRLKRAGVGDAAIEIIVREKLVETAAFTVAEIVALKEAGIGETALNAILSAGSFLKEREPIVYGREVRPLRFTTAKDIIELKNAGVSDAVLEAIVAVSRPAADAQREEAFRLLRGMGIEVHVRHP
jgi:hypothetical protein